MICSVSDTIFDDLKEGEYPYSFSTAFSSIRDSPSLSFQAILS